jgi:hypothetical protein
MFYFKCSGAIGLCFWLAFGIVSASAIAPGRAGTVPVSDDTGESAQVKISRALSSGPANVTKDATVAEMDDAGNLKILRPGTNDFACVPGNPKVIGKPAFCADKAAMQWNRDRAEHKPGPTIRVPGIEYMLAGAVVKDDADPNGPPVHVPPHWMILWPFDPANSGLSTSRKPTGAYIMRAGTPWAHIHVMGPP